MTCTFTAIIIFYICGAQRFFCQAGNQPEQAKYQITCICRNISVSGDIRSSGKNRNGEYREPVPNHQFMISHQKRDGSCYGQCNHRSRCRINRNRNPKGNPWNQHGCHGRFFLFRRIRTCCRCFIDCSGVSEELIPINHQRKIPGYRVHLLSQCFGTADFSAGNRQPYRKRRIDASRRSKVAICNNLTSLLAQPNLICMIQIGKVHLQHPLFSVIRAFVIESSHLPGKNKIFRFFLSGCPMNAPAGVGHLFKHISWIQKRAENGIGFCRYHSGFGIFCTGDFYCIKIFLCSCGKFFYPEQLSLTAKYCLVISLTEEMIKHPQNAVIISFCRVKTAG